MNDTLNSILEIIKKKSLEKPNLIVAIDGRCASGKSTLAGLLQKELNCNLIHMDDFFLRPEQRTPERLATPGENIDHERFLSEVLTPLCEGKEFSYRPFNCSKMALDSEVFVPLNSITIVEGSYSCNKSLWDCYDLRLFISVEKSEQLRRIIKRDGEEYSKVFLSKWIPLEESYFSAYDIANRCDYCFVL